MKRQCASRAICKVVLFSFVLIFISGTAAEGSAEPAGVKLNAPTAGEVVLTIRLAAQGYKWSEGPWSPPLEIRLDGELKTMLIPFRGNETADYNFILGPVAAGIHEIKLVDPADKPRDLKFESFEARVVAPGDPDYTAIRFAPVLLGREENENSDVPLLMWVVEARKAGNTVLDYTMVWSNEDGGTPTPELMARYGRTVDIESIYEVVIDGAGRILSEKIQSEGHEVVDFKGKKIGDHPILRTCTKNNMVCDSGESRFVFAYEPVAFDRLGTRERMLDRQPWINRVAYEELVKEKKLTRVVPDLFLRVDDPRRYALVDVNTEPLFLGPGLEIAIKLRGGEKWYTADMGIESMLQKLPGWMRVGVWLPEGASMEDIEAVRLRALGAQGGRLNILSVGPLVLLGKDFTPAIREIPWKKKRSLSAGGNPVLIPLR